MRVLVPWLAMGRSFQGRQLIALVWEESCLMVLCSESPQTKR